ncbi:glycosyltransferase, partial [candidate division GN15 bacterium]|nr:glycosyltransferase [candidate division GN15 bacterium]
MKLIINGTILNNLHLTGLGVYTHNLVQHLLPLINRTGRFDDIVLIGAEDRCRLLLGSVINEFDVTVAHAPAEEPVRRLWEIHRAVAQHSTPGSTLVYSTTHHGVTRGRVRQVITIHDLFARLFPDNYPSQSKYFNYVLPWVLRKTDRVIVDSESTATDFRTYYGQSPPSMVIHAGLRGDLVNARPERIPALDKQPFFLFVGPSYAYKNADRVIAAFAS